MIPRSPRKKPHELIGEEAIIAKIEEVRKDIQKARRDSSHTAVGNLARLEFDLLKRLDEIREDKGAAPVDPAAMAEALVGAVPELDDVTFARLAEAVDLRRGTRQARREIVR
jgi:hypothetical protein